MSRGLHVDISRYMDPHLVCFLRPSTRDDVLVSLAQTAARFENLRRPEQLNQDELIRKLKEREDLVSTGIGMGVAIPHAKLQEYDQFFIAIGILDKPLPWNAVDGEAVRIIFMVGGPDDQPREYLQLLSTLTHVIRNEIIRKKLLTLQSAEEIIELFRKWPWGADSP